MYSLINGFIGYGWRALCLRPVIMGKETKPSLHLAVLLWLTITLIVRWGLAVDVEEATVQLLMGTAMFFIYSASYDRGVGVTYGLMAALINIFGIVAIFAGVHQEVRLLLIVWWFVALVNIVITLARTGRPKT